MGFFITGKCKLHAMSGNHKFFFVKPGYLISSL